MGLCHVVRHVVRRMKVTAQSSKNLPKIIPIPFWVTFYLSNLFQILSCPFPTVISQATPFLILSKALSHTPLIFFSLSLSLPPTPHSVFIDFVKGNWFVWVASMNKLIWTHIAPYLGFVTIANIIINHAKTNLYIIVHRG